MENLEERRLAVIIFANVVSYSRLIKKNELRESYFAHLDSQF
jgi:hypothetical protein